MPGLATFTIMVTLPRNSPSDVGLPSIEFIVNSYTPRPPEVKAEIRRNNTTIRIIRRFYTHKADGSAGDPLNWLHADGVE